VAARLPLSVDAIDDLRLAVDEATTLLVRVVPGAARIRLELHPRPGELLIVVSALGGVGDPAWPPPELESSLPWRIISGLSDRAEVGESRDVPTIVIAKTTLSVPR
jgi:serine/threonine-protein kinase RsbW